MAKIETHKVVEIMQRNAVEPALLKQIVEEINLAVQPDSGDAETAPPVKKQWCVLLSDPEGAIPSEVEFVAWVMQIPENESTLSLPERVHRAAYEFNTTKKGRLLPARTVGEAVENIQAKHFKEQGVWVKTKTPVLVLRTDNEIPMEKTVRMTGEEFGRVDEARKKGGAK